jgi:hypothetical protein
MNEISCVIIINEAFAVELFDFIEKDVIFHMQLTLIIGVN